MAWFKGDIDYAGERLEKAVEQGVDRLNEVVREGIAQAGRELQEVVSGAGGELRQVVEGAGKEMDAKLENISRELHEQRRFTREDIRDLVDYAADRLGDTLDQRMAVLRGEINGLVQEKVEYFKDEVDSFFIQRQEDLARERRRLAVNVVLAASASVAVGLVSLAYQRLMAGSLDLLGIFRILFASLAGGWGVYLAVNMVRRYLRMSEHRRDFVFLAMRYVGVLRPQSLFLQLMLFLALGAGAALLFFPQQVAELTGNATLMEWAMELGGKADSVP